jgi:hypothetical protein
MSYATGHNPEHLHLLQILPIMCNKYVGKIICIQSDLAIFEPWKV